MEETISITATLDQLPLADATWIIWHKTLSDSFFDELFHEFRGPCYEKDISFSFMVHLVRDSLCLHHGSGYQVLDRTEEQDQLPASVQAIYGKLRRIPIPLSEAFLSRSTTLLAPFLPSNRPYVELPASLRSFRVLLLDGKTFKKAAKRLKAVRGRPGKGLGGRAVVAFELHTGLIRAFSAHPDAHINEAQLVPHLIDQGCALVDGPRLWCGDRGFGDLTQIHRFQKAGDHFVLRYHKRTPFYPDPIPPVRTGTDRFDRTWTEEWGEMKSTRQKPATVRRITLKRPGSEDLILITDLLDAEAYPANDLLELYRERWGIERVFQQISEVFHLFHLIGSTPKAIIFQGAFCMVLYNLLQVIRAIVAETQNRAVGEISTEKLFYDLNIDLLTLHRLNPIEEILKGIPLRAQLIPDLKAYVTERLTKAWSKRWLKAKRKKYQPPKPKTKIKGNHFSIHRVLEEAKKAEGP